MDRDSLDSRTGLVAAPLRMVVGWLFFSALWRRLVLAPHKLDVFAPGSLGEKSNHFLPHAIDPGGLLEWSLRHPDVLQVALWAVSIAEGVAGLLLLLGLFTRASALVVTLLSGTILMSAGWLGTTCLDEWQIGVLGVAGGGVLLLSGAGPHSLDALWMRKGTLPRWLAVWAGSAPLPPRVLQPVAVAGAIASLLLTLGTNQVFHGGIVGPLHNLSAKPYIEIEHAQISDTELQLRAMRTEGPDTHGAFVVAIELTDAQGQVVERLDADRLARLAPGAVDNRYIAKVHAGPHGLVFPLGARAALRIPVSPQAAEASRVRLVEVGGLEFSAELAPAQCSVAQHGSC